MHDLQQQTTGLTGRNWQVHWLVDGGPADESTLSHATYFDPDRLYYDQANL